VSSLGHRTRNDPPQDDRSAEATVWIVSQVQRYLGLKTRFEDAEVRDAVGEVAESSVVRGTRLGDRGSWLLTGRSPGLRGRYVICVPSPTSPQQGFRYPPVDQPACVLQGCLTLSGLALPCDKSPRQVGADDNPTISVQIPWSLTACDDVS
jgi:hypothetical protein